MAWALDWWGSEDGNEWNQTYQVNRVMGNGVSGNKGQMDFKGEQIYAAIDCRRESLSVHPMFSNSFYAEVDRIDGKRCMMNG